MNNLQIEYYLRDFDNFLGVFPSDMHCLPKVISFPSALIINTDPHSLPGTHWVAVFFVNTNLVEYFDSLGKEPYPTSILHFMLSFSTRIFCNVRQIQSEFTLTCGPHCIIFLIYRLRGVSMKTILGKVYSLNVYQNDEFANFIFS